MPAVVGSRAGPRLAIFKPGDSRYLTDIAIYLHHSGEALANQCRAEGLPHPKWSAGRLANPPKEKEMSENSDLLDRFNTAWLSRNSDAFDGIFTSDYHQFWE